MLLHVCAALLNVRRMRESRRDASARNKNGQARREAQRCRIAWHGHLDAGGAGVCRAA